MFRTALDVPYVALVLGSVARYLDPEKKATPSTPPVTVEFELGMKLGLRTPIGVAFFLGSEGRPPLQSVRVTWGTSWAVRDIFWLSPGITGHQTTRHLGRMVFGEN